MVLRHTTAPYGRSLEDQRANLVAEFGVFEKSVSFLY